MSRGGGKSGRTMTPEEAELWGRLAQSVDKAKGKPRVTPHADSTTHATTPRKAQPASAPEPALRAAAAPPKPPSPPPSYRAPPLAEVDRRSARQLASGKLPIDARLDLHGARRRDAHAQLRAFLVASQAAGCKNVLVITGKGGDADTRDHLADALGEGQRGVLKRLVPQWLEEPDLRAIVLGYSAAGVRHGGGGALYVRLRRGSR
jgi:DNA-nicking Smr family endonuclease